jgi:hypothetical protein
MLHYNENKVSEGEAALIMASGFAADIEQMNFNQKLNRFKHLLELKPDVKTNAVHISLNFHSSESLKDSHLQQIAAEYMERIGFGEQPFLVYRHDDAAHLHLHIVSTNITMQSERIDLHDIGKRLSEPARKAIENRYNLVKAESKLFQAQSGIRPADLEKAKYGRLPTKKAISNVIAAVSREYKFTSLAEYNAALKAFNVTALRGGEHTAMFENKGLMYALTDKNGNPVGVPIKSSSFYSKATLRNLEKKFERNAEKRKPYKAEMKERIDQILNKSGQTRPEKFEKQLKEIGIDVLFRQNEQGRIFGITFVDHQNKVVFNGSDLGKGYGAKAIVEKLTKVNTLLKKPTSSKSAADKTIHQTRPPTKEINVPDITGFLEDLLAKAPQEYGTGLPGKRKKRKKRKRQNLAI